MALSDILNKIPELNKGKTPGMDPAEAAKVFDAMLAGGATTIQELIAALNDVDDGSDWRSATAFTI
jgi:hypothetical protein